MKNPAKLLVIVGAVAALSLMSAAVVLGGNALNEKDAQAAPNEQPPITSIDGIDPNECNPVHNVEACGPQNGVDDGAGEQPPITSIDLVDTTKCDLIHSVEACGPEMADLARQDLAARLGIDPGLIDMIRLERVDWPDASLGAPQPGYGYAQVITPGYLIVFEANGQSYEYHTALTPAMPEVVLVQ